MADARLNRGSSSLLKNPFDKAPKSRDRTTSKMKSVMNNFDADKKRLAMQII